MELEQEFLKALILKDIFFKLDLYFENRKILGIYKFGRPLRPFTQVSGRVVNASD
jgi:hypothetical protein